MGDTPGCNPGIRWQRSGCGMHTQMLGSGNGRKPRWRTPTIVHDLWSLKKIWAFRNKNGPFEYWELKLWAFLFSRCLTLDAVFFKDSKLWKLDLTSVFLGGLINWKFCVSSDIQMLFISLLILHGAIHISPTVATSLPHYWSGRRLVASDVTLNAATTAAQQGNQLLGWVCSTRIKWKKINGPDDWDVHISRAILDARSQVHLGPEHRDSNVWTYICIHTCIHTYIHTCIHAYMHTHIHTCMHTYIHT